VAAVGSAGSLAWQATPTYRPTAPVFAEGGTPAAEAVGLGQLLGRAGPAGQWGARRAGPLGSAAPASSVWGAGLQRDRRHDAGLLRRRHQAGLGSGAGDQARLLGGVGLARR
jgi:hypothetical protein